MALPQAINAADPADSDNPSAGAARIRQLKTYLEDVFGLTDNTNYTAGAFAITTAGVVTVKQNPFAPDTSDGSALGSATKMWSDLFLASAGVINFNNGDVTLTHAANLLTLAGGNLAFADATPQIRVGSTALTFYNNAGSSERMRLTDAGILVIGTTVVTGAVAGDLVLANAKHYHFLNAAGATSVNYGLGSDAFDNLYLEVPSVSTLLGLYWAGGLKMFFGVESGGVGINFDLVASLDHAAPAGGPVVYAKDIGGGKSQLCARFATGAVQVLATEP